MNSAYRHRSIRAGMTGKKRLFSGNCARNKISAYKQMLLVKSSICFGKGDRKLSVILRYKQVTQKTSPGPRQ